MDLFLVEAETAYLSCGRSPMSALSGFRAGQAVCVSWAGLRTSFARPKVRIEPLPPARKASAAVLHLLGWSAHFVCQTESAHQAPPPKHNEERDRKGRAARQHCKALSQSGSPPLSKQARALTITRRAGTRAGRRAAGRAAGAARGPKSLLQCSRKPGWQGSTASTAVSTAPHAN